MNVLGPTRIPFKAFTEVLIAGNSPAVSEARGMYDAFVEYNIPAELGLAFFYVESQLGTLGICKKYNTKSIGNVRSPENPKFGGKNINDPEKGEYTRYSTWTNGVKDWCERIRGPKYVGMGLDTLEEILPKYAPSFDNNDPTAYIQTLEDLIKSWGVSPETKPQKGNTTMVTKPNIISRPSPNRGYGADHKPQAIVWHITAGSGGSALSWLTNSASGASSNYLIMEDGTTYELVPPTESAWANGAVNKPNMNNALVRNWINNGINPNRRTISIEHAGDTSYGKGGSLTSKQVAASIALTAWLCERFSIPATREAIIPHAFIDSVNRPYCPGFSEAEWNDRIGKVASLVKGATIPVIKPEKEGGIVAEYIDRPGPRVENGLDENGEPFTVIKWGGQMKEAPNINLQDVGITGPGMDGAEYDRSIRNNKFTEYNRTPR